MVLRSEGRIWLLRRTMRGGARVYIPANVPMDSQFPFQEEGKIIVEIDPENDALKLLPFEDGENAGNSSHLKRPMR